MAESVISLQGVELAFGEKKVLQGVDLEVKKGEPLAKRKCCRGLTWK